MPSEPAPTILLVDDDDLIRQFAALCLTRMGFCVLEASNGEAALTIYQQQRAEITLVLTDMVMPGLFGDQLALRLWESAPDLPVVFMSGNTPEALESTVLLEIGQNFMSKPFEIGDLAAIIQRRLSANTASQESTPNVSKFR